MVKAQNDVGLRSSQFVTQLHERLVGESPFVVSNPLRVDERNRPTVRDLNHSQRLHRTQDFAHDLRIVVVAGEKISLPRSSLGKGERSSIGLMTTVLRYVTGDDQDIDVSRKDIYDRREVLGRVVVPESSARIGEQMRVAQLRYEHHSSVDPG